VWKGVLCALHFSAYILLCCRTRVLNMCRVMLLVESCFMLHISMYVFRSCYTTKVLYCCLTLPINSCPFHTILFNVITLMILFVGEYKSWSTSGSIFLHPPLTSLHLGLSSEDHVLSQTETLSAVFNVVQWLLQYPLTSSTVAQMWYCVRKALNSDDCVSLYFINDTVQYCLPAIALIM
jgi:hypothetical protein